ncbi:formate dehydrogenase accessory protein FdhE [Pseudomonas sp. C27(2019)]|uniref:formate dehydrogenase accessory protein FdhE n=1 Tax=Pseudomonas sp. C27(2019) TaxID=2604941 RepID=UPI001245BED0|nr:formate dehydrogenase accessory protein FdhE [Pseudomonas sp. C27(2019)]QEY59968.1 formate dehydrogenase accessory protein FdhE [Pseudomonas sp. C27(2019)]
MSSNILEPGEIEGAAMTPPFVQRPPADLFSQRAKRLDALSEGHPMAAYLRLLASICRAQQSVLDAPPKLSELDTSPLCAALQHDMPPLAVDTLLHDSGWHMQLDAWLEAFTQDNENLPDAVCAALQQLREADAEQRQSWASALLGGHFSQVPEALVPFLGAALQLAWQHWLKAIDIEDIREREDQTECPCCGSLPVAGIIHQRRPINGVRYLVCSLCASQWHYVRLKCSHCLSTRELDYLHFDDSPHGIKAEACPDCHTYLKQLYLEIAPTGEAFSADLASLDLDMRLAEQGLQRRAPNLLLAPGGEGKNTGGSHKET